jgi:hypothetical protein
MKYTFKEHLEALNRTRDFKKRLRLKDYPLNIYWRLRNLILDIFWKLK